MKNKNLSVKSLNFAALAAKLSKRYGKHAVFGVIILILMVYIFVVLKINSLASASPSADQTTQAAPLIPKVDQETVDHIQTLEQNNTQIHALFEQARNNPFQE
jgi:predicted PurR-regulated permease PerM